MGTFNGARYLKEQLDSFEKQTFTNWKLIVSDDGSTDGTIEILKSYQKLWPDGKLEIRNGPKKGFCQNFIYLLNDPNMSFDYYCFSDQDDIWSDFKLTRAILLIKKIEKKRSIPILYGARTTLVNRDGIYLGTSPLYKKPSFSNALVQNIAGGNTMVFNSLAKNIMAIELNYSVISHDWWAYLVITGAGGEFIYDTTPVLAYRQHEANLVGSKNGLSKKLLRLKKLFKGQLKNWNDNRINALMSKIAILSSENQKIFSEFVQIRNKSWIKRLTWALTTKVKRQSLLENSIYFLALILNKV